MEIRHIPGKSNPVDSFSRQLVSDALVRKDSVKDGNAEYVMRLRVPDNATDEDIQNALHKFFNSSPQGSQGHQGQSILSTSPQDNCSSMNEDGQPSIISATAISKIQLDDERKNSLHYLFQSESPYSEILLELSEGTRQVVKSNLIFKCMNSLLVVHDQHQD